jgi:hypothetical protein
LPDRPLILLAISPHRSDGCDDRNPVKEKHMSDNAIDSENIGKPAPDTAKPKGARKAHQEGQAREEAEPVQEGRKQADGGAI